MIYLIGCFPDFVLVNKLLPKINKIRIFDAIVSRETWKKDLWIIKVCTITILSL